MDTLYEDDWDAVDVYYQRDVGVVGVSRMSACAVKPLNAVEQNLQCGICLDTLRTAKTLPCLHSFCVECISKHIDCNEAHGSYKCPTCIHEHPVPNDGARGLPTDFTKVELCRIVRAGKIANTKAAARERRMSPSQSRDDGLASSSDGRSSPCRSCDMCAALGQSQTSQAVAACLHCGKMLCVECKEQHKSNEATKQHTVSELKVQSTDVHCSRHTEDVLTNFCLPCSTFVCVVCIHRDHSNHSCLDLKSVESTLRNRLVRTLKALNGDLSRLNGYLKFVNEYCHALDKTRSDIRSRAEQEREMIDKQREHLIRQINEEAERRTKAIKNREHELLERLDSLCGADSSKHIEQRESVKRSIATMTDVNTLVRNKLKEAENAKVIEADKEIPELLKAGEALHDKLSLPTRTKLIRAEFQSHEPDERPLAELTILDHADAELGELFVKQILRSGGSNSATGIAKTSASEPKLKSRHNSGPAEVARLPSSQSAELPYHHHHAPPTSPLALDNHAPHPTSGGKASHADYDSTGACGSPKGSPRGAGGGVSFDQLHHHSSSSALYQLHHVQQPSLASHPHHSSMDSYHPSSSTYSGTDIGCGGASLAGGRMNPYLPLNEHTTYDYSSHSAGPTTHGSSEHIDVPSMVHGGAGRLTHAYSAGSVSPSPNEASSYINDPSCPWQYVVKYGQLYDDCFMALHSDERIVVFKKSRSMLSSDPNGHQWTIDYLRSPGHPLYEWLLQSVETRTNVLREPYHREIIDTLTRLIDEHDGNQSEHSNDDSVW